MTNTRRKTMSIVYNGVDIWRELNPYLENFAYTDSVDESDKISLSVSDRDLRWSDSWSPKGGDIITPSIQLENWNSEGERIGMVCGTFIVDDFGFEGPPVRGSINGVSAPVNTNFKETPNTKTWESASVSLIAQEIAAKYGLSLVYDVSFHIPISKMEQSRQPDSTFLKSLCEKYGLGMKIYANRLVIWDYDSYFMKPVIAELTPQQVSKWSYQSTMQGVYTGVEVSFTNLKTKKTVTAIVGTGERLYRTTQRADSEADAQLIGRGILAKTNRKAETMRITMPPALGIVASGTIGVKNFGKMDGTYFVERVSHNIGRASYTMQLELSRVPYDVEHAGQGEEASAQSAHGYVIQKGDTLWDLAQRFFGDPTRCTLIYEYNKEVIEQDAVAHGRKNSGNGYWIYPGLSIVIPEGSYG